MRGAGGLDAPRPATAIVTGATGQIGHYLLPRLVDAGLPVLALSRSRHRGRAGIQWFTGDLEGPVNWPHCDGESTLFHLAHLSLLPKHIGALAALNVRRIIAFSSTGRFSKSGSNDPTERALVRGLARAEERFVDRCEAGAIVWTLFRPTMIYSQGIDRNVSFIARTVRRWGFFPIAGKGTGLRQPVHAEDLAAACVAALTNGRCFRKAYTLSGGEILSYRDLVERVFVAQNRKPRIVVVPVFALRLAIALIRLMPRFGHLTPEMADRMNADLCFDHSAATRDFGFAPRQRFVYSTGIEAETTDGRPRC